MNQDPLKTLFEKGYDTDSTPDGFVGQVLAAKATQRRRNRGIATVLVMVCLAFGLSQNMQKDLPTNSIVEVENDDSWVLELHATYDTYENFENNLYESEMDIDAVAELPEDTYTFLQLMDLDS